MENVWNCEENDDIKKGKRNNKTIIDALPWPFDIIYLPRNITNINEILYSSIDRK